MTHGRSLSQWSFGEGQGHTAQVATHTPIHPYWQFRFCNVCGGGRNLERNTHRKGPVGFKPKNFLVSGNSGKIQATVPPWESISVVTILKGLTIDLKPLLEDKKGSQMEWNNYSSHFSGHTSSFQLSFPSVSVQKPHQQLIRMLQRANARFLFIHGRKSNRCNLLMEQQLFSDSVNKATSSWIASFTVLPPAGLNSLNPMLPKCRDIPLYCPQKPNDIE